MAVKAYAQILSRNAPTPQSEPIPGREADMTKNSAGGFSFAVDDWERYRRFLILGSEGGSYYASERKLTKENATVVQRVMQKDAARAVELLCAVSEAGRAPKNDPAIFALSVAAADASVETRKLAYAALPRVCRTGTHLFHFAAMTDGMRGWSRGLRNAVARWYGARTVDGIAYQLAKYQQRDGWGHSDLLRLSHPAAEEPGREAAFRWVMGLPLTERTVARKAAEKTVTYRDVSDALPGLLAAMDEAKTAEVKRLCVLIREYGLTREMVPTERLNDLAVWEALLEKMPLTAMIRNLGKMTSIGLVAPLSAGLKTVTNRLADAEYLRKSRVHPLGVLVALKTYGNGKGDKGSLTWSPVAQVIDALDGAFYGTFGNAPKTGKNWLLALDVSGSMGSSFIAGMANMSAREGSAAMALVTANAEPNHHIIGFTGGTIPLKISPRQRLDDVTRYVAGLPFERTDCAQPMLYAMKHKLAVDVFVIYTDSETWCGDIHPTQALAKYREQSGLPARLITVGMVSNGFTVADPDDAGSLDVVGFDLNCPALMAEFVGGTPPDAISEED